MFSRDGFCLISTFEPKPIAVFDRFGAITERRSISRLRCVSFNIVWSSKKKKKTTYKKYLRFYITNKTQVSNSFKFFFLI